MSRDDLIQAEGEITEVLAGGNFAVILSNDQTITAKLSGKMRKFYIKVIVGDRVTVGLSPYDPTHGLILYRHKGKPKPRGDDQNTAQGEAQKPAEGSAGAATTATTATTAATAATAAKTATAKA